MNKFEALRLFAEVAALDGSTFTGRQLVGWLNQSGYRTNTGRPYLAGGRGIYRLISATYDRLERQGLHQDAINIAQRFTMRSEFSPGNKQETADFVRGKVPSTR